MILVDANLLIYAFASSTPQHRPAKQWLDAQLNGLTIVGLPWPSLLTFSRLVTNPRVFEHPAPLSKAWAQVLSWLDSPQVRVPHPTERHHEILGSLLKAANIRGNLISDAHLAALAIEHGFILCSCDSDFARFPGLRWQNPLNQ